MKNLIQYTSKVSELFHIFLREIITKEELIAELQTLEKYHKDLIQNKELYKELWFKFSKDDNLATTIRELNIDLSSDSRNKKFILEQMQYSISLEGELLIYYS